MLQSVQMNQQIIKRITSLMSDGRNIATRQDLETKFSPRDLPLGAEVMRTPPSPTGFVHIGTVYAGLVNERIAHQSGGVFILRIEDTDKKREVAGSTDAIVDAFNKFEIKYDEGPVVQGAYGPYFQSQRADIYLCYALELLQNGRAYPCFATPEELKSNTEKQQAAKIRPGYYGQWALWRDRSDAEITAALDSGKPFVLRFKSLGNHEKRIVYQDVFKGRMEVPQNDLDVPLIKSDEHRLPTYHLAHIVDDHLMRVTKVFRSDEWLPSTALHIELAESLGIEPFSYGHFAPISIVDKNGGGKRKLSKRKDDEADVQYWLQAGYPIKGIQAYLLGLANSNFEDWYTQNPQKAPTEFKLSLEKLASSRAPLLDMTKLQDYCKNYIANLAQDEFNKCLIDFQSGAFKRELLVDSGYTNQVLSIERSGDKPRKDLSAWSQALENYGYFFDAIYETDFKPKIAAQLQDFKPETIKSAVDNFVATYNEADDQPTWFEKLKSAAAAAGFATDNQSFKQNPQSYEGSTADFARIIRVLLTGKNRTPNLWTVMKVMGDSRVNARLDVQQIL